MRLVLAAMPLALAACAGGGGDDRARAARAQAGLDRELAGLVAEAPRNCLPNFNRTNVQGYGKTLVYEVTRGLKYRNDTSGGCENLGRRDDILVTQSLQGAVCAGDIARTVDRQSQFQTGSCALGEFIPYRKP